MEAPDSRRVPSGEEKRGEDSGEERSGEERVKRRVERVKIRVENVKNKICVRNKAGRGEGVDK